MNQGGLQKDSELTADDTRADHGQVLPHLKRIVQFGASAWGMVGMCLLLVAVVDLGLGLYFSVTQRDDFSDSDQVDLSTLGSAYGNPTWLKDFYREYGQVRMRWSPYVYWKAAPRHGLYVNIDSHGARATLSSHHSWPCKQPLKIFMFGGSTMFGYYVRDGYTIASWLQRFLDSSPYCTEVFNFGQDGYVSTQEMLALLEQLKVGNRPDLVIFYDGWNDAAAANENGEAGLTFSERTRQDDFNITNPTLRRDRKRLYVAAAITFGMHTAMGNAAKHIVRALSPNRFALLQGRLVRLGATASYNPDIVDPTRAAHDVLRVYLRNKELIESVAQRFGFECLFYWQPCVLTKQVVAPLEKRSMDKYYGEEIGVTGNHLFHEVYADVQADGNRDGIVDLSDLFGSSGKLYYFDEVHLTEDGNGVVAQRLLSDVETVLSGRRRRSARGF